MEEHVKSLGGVPLVPVVAVVAVVVQAVLAGAATFSRRAAEREFERESGVTASYSAQLGRGGEAAVAAGPHAELLPSADIAGTLRILQSLGDQSTVTLASVKAMPSTTPGRQSFSITGRASPTQLCAFLAGIEHHERLMVIEAGRVSPGTGDEVRFEVALSTHHTGGPR